MRNSFYFIIPLLFTTAHSFWFSWIDEEHEQKNSSIYHQYQIPSERKDIVTRWQVARYKVEPHRDLKDDTNFIAEFEDYSGSLKFFRIIADESQKYANGSRIWTSNYEEILVFGSIMLPSEENKSATYKCAYTYERARVHEAFYIARLDRERIRYTVFDKDVHLVINNIPTETAKNLPGGGEGLFSIAEITEWIRKNECNVLPSNTKEADQVPWIKPRTELQELTTIIQTILEVVADFQTKTHVETKKKKKIRDLIAVGTMWCGHGSRAKSYMDLGEHADTDACCRRHDWCNWVIVSGGTIGKANFGSSIPFTQSRCTCDNEFSACLRDVATTRACFVWDFFFRIMQLPCFNTIGESPKRPVAKDDEDWLKCFWNANYCKKPNTSNHEFTSRKSNYLKSPPPHACPNAHTGLWVFVSQNVIGSSVRQTLGIN